MLVSDKVELARAPDFVLGRLNVAPVRRELVRDDGEREVLEHRVMQVLVALSSAQGGIVTRDELILCCWDGRVVGEDAITRAISRLRRSAEGIGEGSFRIETITKIGYRLTSDDMPADPVPLATMPGEVGGGAPAPRSARRRFIIGAVATGSLAVCGGALFHHFATRRSVPPEVLSLITHADQLRDQNTREGQYEAIGLLQRVVALAPDYAEGWGRLGCAYGIVSHYRPQPEGKTLRGRAEAAGRRALELEPGNVYGELALGIAVPFVGHYLERERHFERALRRRPTNDDALIYSAVALQFVGRNIEAVSLYEKIRHRPLTPANYNNYIRALWSAGRIEELDQAMDDAATLYPAQSTIWFTRFNLLMYSGRANAAIALVQEEEKRPSLGVDPAELVAQAHAMQSRDPAEIDALMTKLLENARKAAGSAEVAIRHASAFQRLDDAFAVAEAYYFSRGFAVPDAPGERDSVSIDQRQTRLLFEPVTKALRTDSRFADLIAALGFERYWREAGIQPDYRRV